jgi:hypothetical protein
MESTARFIGYVAIWCAVSLVIIMVFKLLGHWWDMDLDIQAGMLIGMFTMVFKKGKFL